MTKGRLEAFSDGVLAIIITIMVLELKAPQSPEPAALLSLVPVLLSYVLSFLYVGIYWNNHHHLFQIVHHVTGPTLLANLHLLFWLSLIPFGTAWMGQTNFGVWSVVIYGIILLLAGAAYTLLTRVLIAGHGRESPIALAMGRDFKGIVSIVIYVLAIGVAFVEPRVGCLLYGVVALIWLIPDRRIETRLTDRVS
jgi:uncharacterized membrane protein